MALRQMVPTRTLAKCAALAPSVRCSAVRPFRTSKLVVNAERLRLGNLAPEPGSRRKELRKGRGYAAGQGGTCGFGNRGQKARSGPGVRPGFEGGQMPLYRRLPKLRGIAGGMGAGQPDFVVVNLDDLEKHFEANEEVTLEKIREKVQNISGRDAKLPLKVLGDGTLSKPLNVKAAKFSEVAKTKITEAGGKTEEVAGRKKWTKKNFKKVVAQMAADGLDYKKEQLKKKVAALKAKGLVNKKRAINAAKPAKNTKAVGKGKK